MTQKLINTGTSANKGDGDPLRLAFQKINDNFTELYTGSPIVPQDLRGSVFGDDSTLLVDGVNSSIPKANIEDSTNWDTAFGWGNHSTAGYLTSYTVTESDVTTHQAALLITESQISDLQSYLTSVAFGDLTTTPTTVAGYGITDVYTKTETDSAVSTAVSNLVGDAPAVLDTLSELADAIGDDADFLTTLNGNIALKANTADLATVATSGSYNDLADQPDVSDLTDVQGKLAAAGGISEDDAIVISMIFG